VQPGSEQLLAKRGVEEKILLSFDSGTPVGLHHSRILAEKVNHVSRNCRVEKSVRKKRILRFVTAKLGAFARKPLAL
jgi:hypothetical protein